MEGRNKINYGHKDGIISIKDIEYMFNVINSDLTEEEKTVILYYYCNYSSLAFNKKVYSDLGLPQVSEIDKLMSIYRDYENFGFFKRVRNSYKCTLEEIAIRLKKINSVYEIINSNIGDYQKVEQLLPLFKNSELFRKSYALFVKYGKKDERLNLAREALNNFDSLYAKFKEYEEKQIIDNVKYLLKINDYLENYEYAVHVIKYYIESSESYKESDFLSELGIDKDIFEFCASTIEELDVDLYKKFISKKEANNKIRYIANVETISDLAQGIKTGVLKDGTEFNLLEFIKRVPFKRHFEFTQTLTEFMKRNNPTDMNAVIKYVYSTGLNRVGTFAPLDLKTIYYVKTTINSVTLTKEDNDIIIDYLRVNDIPVIYKTYLIARLKYLNGEINVKEVKQKRLKLNQKKAKTLIPSTK